METWRLILHPAAHGALNMAADEAILNAVSAKNTLPTLRFYAWEPACLSLGYAQRSAEVDRDRLTAQGWHLVRRMTGGRAILHTDELTYSVTLPLEHPLAAGGIVESYRRISAALLQGVNAVGLHADADRHGERQGKRPGPVCFEVPSDYEITANGKKLVGSAQVRRQGMLLQHGTLPLYGDVSRICDALVFPDEAAREAARAHVLDRAITLADALGTRIEWAMIAEEMAAAFASCFDLSLERDELTASELADTEVLAGKYGSDAWNMKV